MSFIFTSIILTVNSQDYNTCLAAAAGTNIANGGCINNATLDGSVNMAGICLGGGNPATYISFVAGSCSQFTINPDFNLDPTGQSFGYSILTAGCAGIAGFPTECVGNLVNGQDFTISGISYDGGVQLTPGTEYVLRLYGAVGTNTMDICYNANVPEQASNECSGAVGLGTTPTTYFNGGDCSYNGTYDDTPSNPSSDAAASQYCAGSLENTQWVNFSPTAGATSFLIEGSSINCSAGACAYQFGIFSGTCGSLVNEGCVSNGNPCGTGPDPNSAITTAGGNILSWSGVSATGFTATISPSSGSFTGTEEFYLAMDGNADAQCYYTLTGTNIQPLPIELIYFQGTKFNNANQLAFEVASQLNNDYFSIERSTDGEVWTVVGVIDGAGTSSEQIKYSLLDFDYEKTINYYRLKQTDFDGVFKYSRIISIDNNPENKTIFEIYNLLGQKVDGFYKGLVIIKYTDGTSEKKLQ